MVYVGAFGILMPPLLQSALLVVHVRPIFMPLMQLAKTLAANGKQVLPAKSLMLKKNAPPLLIARVANVITWMAVTSKNPWQRQNALKIQAVLMLMGMIPFIVLNLKLANPPPRVLLPALTWFVLIILLILSAN
jgi:hypothetical protein